MSPNHRGEQQAGIVVLKGVCITEDGNATIAMTLTQRSTTRREAKVTQRIKHNRRQHFTSSATASRGPPFARLKNTSRPRPHAQSTAHPKSVACALSSTARARPTSPEQFATFLSRLQSHYTSRSDTLSPAFFTQLCRSYTSGASDERGFYVGVYRLFCSSGAQHLWEQFEDLLLVDWTEKEGRVLQWLRDAAMEDVGWQMRVAGHTAGGRVWDIGWLKQEKHQEGEVEGIASVVDAVETGVEDSRLYKEEHVRGAEYKDFQMLDSEAAEGGPLAVMQKRKKKVPIHGYRAVRVSHIVGILDEAATAALSPKKATAVSPPEITVTPPSSKKKQTARHANVAKPPSPPLFSEIGLSPPTSAPPSPPRKPNLPPRASTSTTSFPSSAPNSAHSSSKAGPTIYPTRRAIFSRTHSKPFTHALCGARFGHPEEVRRHHNGQSGRPGCWEQRGKPEGEANMWNGHESCKTTLGMIRYKAVEGGFVVDDWGVGGAWLCDPEDVGLATEKQEARREKVDRRKKGKRSKPKKDEESENCDSDEEPEQVGKKAKVQTDGETVESTVQRAAALGLRARK